MPPGCLFELWLQPTHGTPFTCDFIFTCHSCAAELLISLLSSYLPSSTTVPFSGCCEGCSRMQLCLLPAGGDLLCPPWDNRKAAVAFSCACCLQVEIQDTIKPLPGQSEAKQMKKASRFSITATTMFCEALPC